MRRCVTAAIAAAVVGLGFDFVPAAAQRALTPVTDAMLRNPDPAGLADVAAHPEQLGIQPARSDRSRQRRAHRTRRTGAA